MTEKPCRYGFLHDWSHRSEGWIECLVCGQTKDYPDMNPDQKRFDELEAHRRDTAKTFDPGPLHITFGVFDYSSASMKCDAALSALDEALPLGQHERIRLAYTMLRDGTDELGRWLRAKGMHV